MDVTVEQTLNPGGFGITWTHRQFTFENGLMNIQSNAQSQCDYERATQDRNDVGIRSLFSNYRQLIFRNSITPSYNIVVA